MIEETAIAFKVPLSKYSKLKELYYAFSKQYRIKTNSNILIIEERIREDGIKITPKDGEILGVRAIKSSSELEITLKENYTKNGFLVFETKDSNFILINYNYQ